MAAACGLQLGGSLLHQRKGRQLLVVCISHLPIMILAGPVLHFLSGARIHRAGMETTFSRYWIHPGDLWRNSAANDHRDSGVRDAPPQLPQSRLADSVVWWELSCSPASVTLYLQIAGLRKIYRESKETCILILCVWGVAIILAPANIIHLTTTGTIITSCRFLYCPSHTCSNRSSCALTAARARCFRNCRVVAGGLRLGDEWLLFEL